MPLKASCQDLLPPAQVTSGWQGPGVAVPKDRQCYGSVGDRGFIGDTQHPALLPSSSTRNRVIITSFLPPPTTAIRLRWDVS